MPMAERLTTEEGKRVTRHGSGNIEHSLADLQVAELFDWLDELFGLPKTEEMVRTNPGGGGTSTDDRSCRPLALSCAACGEILPSDTAAGRIKTCHACRRVVRPGEVLGR